MSTLIGATVGSTVVPNPTIPANLAACNIGEPAYICDQDGVLGEKGALRVASLLHDIRRINATCGDAGEQGFEVTVAVVESAGRSDFDEIDAEAAAHNIMDTWGVGHPACDNGIVMILAIEQRKIGFKIGAGANAFFNDAGMSKVIKEMRAHLRAGHAAEALSQALVMIGNKLTEKKAKPRQTSFKHWRFVSREFVEGVTTISVVALLAAAQYGWSLLQFRRRAALFDRALAAAAEAAALADNWGPDDAPPPPGLPPPVDPALPNNPDIRARTCVVCLSPKLRRIPGGVGVDGGAVFPCGHCVCEACLWRFGPHCAPSSIGWTLESSSPLCPICSPGHRDLDNDPKGPSKSPKAPHEVLWSLRMRNLLASTAALSSSHLGYPNSGGIVSPRGFGKRGTTFSIALNPRGHKGDRDLTHGQPSPSWMSDESRRLLTKYGPEIVHPGSVPELGPANGNEWSQSQKKLAQESVRRWRDVRAHAEAKVNASAARRRTFNYGRGWFHHSHHVQSGPPGSQPALSSWANVPSDVSFSGERGGGSRSSGSGRSGGGGSW